MDSSQRVAVRQFMAMADGDSLTDIDLLGRAASDPEVFGAFYRRNVAWVVAYLARRVADREAVADLVAESFAQALIGLPRYDAGRGDPNAWLFGIVNNQLSAYWRRGTVERRAQKRLAMERQLPDADDLERIDRFGEEPVAVALLELLPDEQREAVRERVLRERGYDEIAVDAGVPEATVRKRVSRGLATLRRVKGAPRG
jgi:RNA polymerase sigma-70 factor (ECF subfamily)